MTHDSVPVTHGVTHGAMPLVIVACMAGRPEDALFRSLDSAAVTLAFHSDRTLLLAAVRSIRPLAVVFPTFDAHGVACAPLIARLRDEAPDVLSYVLLGAGRPPRGFVEAVRAGANPAPYRD